MKKILLINSLQENNQTLISLLEELNKRGNSFYIALSDPILFNQLIKNNWQVQKINPGPKLTNKFNQILFIVSLPLLYLAYFAYLTYYKIQKINCIVCININEKIIFTPIAAILKMRVIWIEDVNPIVLNNKIIKPLFFIYRLCSNLADIITFNDYFKTYLKKMHFKEKNIKIIYPGIKLNKREYQDNLFNELAKSEGKGFRRKFFTIGTVAELNSPRKNITGGKKQKIETLFQAIKNCLTIIPNMQLIIIGEGQERKNLTWLNKKMELDNITWFVGEQAHLKKWLDSFDIFIVTSDSLELDNINIILQAMIAKLPIIGPRNFGLEEFIPHPEYLTEEDNNEMLTSQIIKLWKDKNLRLKLGQAGREKVEKYFTLERMVEEFERVL